MATNAQRIRVGLFATATLVLVAVVVVVFGGLRFWEHTARYRIVFESSVIGLEPGAQVYLNGIKVGTVAELGVSPSDIRKVEVVIEVEDGTPIHADTRAMLQLAGLTGLKTIDLRGGTPATPALPPGSQIAAGVGLLDKLEAQAQVIVDQSSELMKRAALLTDDLIAIAEPARRAAENLAGTSAQLRDMVGENRAVLHQSLLAFRQTARGASDLLDGQVAPMLVGAGDVIADLKRLLANNAAPLRAAMFDLREASRSFKELAREVRQKPSRLLFSSAPDERKLP